MSFQVLNAGEFVSLMANKADHSVVGRTKTVIVASFSGEAIAIITEIFAQEAPVGSDRRLEFCGPVKLEKKAFHHVESVIMPIVDQIVQSLGFPLKNFVISVSNIGLSATKGVGIEINGFSADITLFMALLSAHLQLGLRQDIIATGHISSLSGDVAPVLDIPAKIEAVAASEDISEFVFPDFEKDRSITQLMDQDEIINATNSINQHRGRIKLTVIESIHDAVQTFLPEESLVMAALSKGFFDTKPNSIDFNNPVNRCVSFLLEDNEKRFWETTQDFLFRHEGVKAKTIIKLFIDYHLKQKRYPASFGEQLYRLAMSLPILARRLDGLFPLVTIDQCIALSQHAKPTDHNDVQILYKLTSQDEFGKKFETNLEEPSPTGDIAPEEQLLRKILFELSDTIFTEKIGKLLDEARANYSIKTVTIKDASEFNQAITGFFIHLMRHTQSPEGHVSYDAASSEAIDRLTEAFRNKGGYEGALAEAKTGIKGGLRYIFDVMTDYEKADKMGKYKIMVLKEAIDTFDWESKVKMSAHILKQYGRYLPGAFKTLEPEQLAHYLDEGILLLADGEKDIDHWLRKH